MLCFSSLLVSLSCSKNNFFNGEKMTVNNYYVNCQFTGEPGNWIELGHGAHKPITMDGEQLDNLSFASKLATLSNG